MACASTVAVVVPSPATSDVLLASSRTICAPMFSSVSFSSISFATVTPSLVIVGDPNFLSRMTLRPLGPRVTLTALARLLTPRRMPCREASPYTICFAMSALLLLFLLGGCGSRRTALNDGKDIVLLHDEEVLAAQPNLLTPILAEQHAVALLDIERA